MMLYTMQDHMWPRRKSKYYDLWQSGFQTNEMFNHLTFYMTDDGLSFEAFHPLGTRTLIVEQRLKIDGVDEFLNRPSTKLSSVVIGKRKWFRQLFPSVSLSRHILSARRVQSSEEKTPSLLWRPASQYWNKKYREMTTTVIFKWWPA